MAVSALDTELSESTVEHLKRHFSICHSWFGSCEPHWFSKSDVFGVHLSGESLESWDAWHGVRTLCSSGRSSGFASSLPIVSRPDRCEVWQDLFRPLLPSSVFPNLTEQLNQFSGLYQRKLSHIYLWICCVHGRKWVHDLPMSPSSTTSPGYLL